MDFRNFSAWKSVSQNADTPEQRMYNQKREMFNRINARQEREELVEETTQRVLSRLSMHFNTIEGIKQIEALKNALDELFNKLKK